MANKQLINSICNILQNNCEGLEIISEKAERTFVQESRGKIKPFKTQVLSLMVTKKGNKVYRRNHRFYIPWVIIEDTYKEICSETPEFEARMKDNPGLNDVAVIFKYVSGGMLDLTDWDRSRKKKSNFIDDKQPGL